MGKEMTAVEWYIDELYKLNVKFLNSRYGNQMTTVEYSDCKEQIKNQAKEMEKERMIGLLEWMNLVNQSDPMRLETDNDDIVEQYYNETYGGNK